VFRCARMYILLGVDKDEKCVPVFFFLEMLTCPRACIDFVVKCGVVYCTRMFFFFFCVLTLLVGGEVCFFGQIDVGRSMCLSRRCRLCIIFEEFWQTQQTQCCF
jgi:hypothetical protein